MVKGKVQLTGAASEGTQNRVFDILTRMGVEHDSCLHSADEIVGDPHSMPCIAVLDHSACERHINELLGAKKLYDLLICDNAISERKPGILAKSLDFFILGKNDRELTLRVERCVATDAIATPAVCAIDQRFRQNMIGAAPIFLALLKTLERCAKIDVPVLIVGETGTGKELAARALHYGGARHAGPFQALNCGAIPDYLVENELFGHTRGAYTDARHAQPGLVELACGGTLFLDEVEALSYKAQTALLRFLQDGSYRELGGGAERRADVRVVSACNKNLESLAAAGEFRQDLMYRLNTLMLELPPLRKRREDIPLLVTHFLRKCAVEFSLGSKHFHPHSLAASTAYDWPGNIRELENFVRRAYLLTDGTLIFHSPNKSPILTGDNIDHIPHHDDEDGEVVPFSDAKRLVVDYFEAHYIAELLHMTAGNLSRAARLAGKERRAFCRLAKKHGISRMDF